MSTKLKVVGLGGDSGDLNWGVYIRYAESILFNAPPDEEIDYVRLEVNTGFYDPEYERSIRKKNLNLIYFLDEISQHLNLPASQCIDILIDIERRISHSQMLGDARHIADLHRSVLRLSDLIQAECTFLQAKLSPQDYATLSHNVPHLGVPPDLATFLFDLKRLSEIFRGDADHLMELNAA